jgi:hypothetical protein
MDLISGLGGAAGTICFEIEQERLSGHPDATSI